MFNSDPLCTEYLVKANVGLGESNGVNLFVTLVIHKTNTNSVILIQLISSVAIKHWWAVFEFSKKQASSSSATCENVRLEVPFRTSWKAWVWSGKQCAPCMT